MQNVSLTVGGLITLEGLVPKSFERLRLAFELRNPEYEKKRRLDLFLGDTPEKIDIAEETPSGGLRIPRGAIARVKEVLAKDDVVATIRCDRTFGEPLAFSRKPDLRFYQALAVEKLLKHTQGVVVLPCAGGKTRTGIGAIAGVGRTTLVIVPNDELLSQWVAGTEEHLGVKAGVLDAKRKEVDADIVVATVWSAMIWLDAHPGWADRFGLVVVDEAHRVASVTYTRFMCQVRAKWRLALTATPYREDGMGQLISWSFGDTLVEFTVDELARLGFLIKPEIVFVESGFRPYFDPNDLRSMTKQQAQLYKEIVASTSRNALIVDLVKREVDAGEVLLLLANNKSLCIALGDALRALGVDCQIMTGDVKRKAPVRPRKSKKPPKWLSREKSVTAMREGRLRCILATSLADEGLDLPRISRIVLAFPERARGRTTQRVGRLMRDFPGKKPRLYDIVDDHPTLLSRAKGRMSTYKSLSLL